MNRILQATYHDGRLILDEKLDAAFEDKKLTLILVEDAESAEQIKADTEERKQRFFEKVRTYSAKLPEDYIFDREEIHDRDCFHRL